MDEYLFITLAKLKADRLKLEREQQAATVIDEPPLESAQHPATHSARQSPKTGWFSRQTDWIHPWREQS
jgi:hypothetical protein